MENLDLGDPPAPVGKALKEVVETVRRELAEKPERPKGDVLIYDRRLEAEGGRSDL